jgi:hypothetical protein
VQIISYYIDDDEAVFGLVGQQADRPAARRTQAAAAAAANYVL